MGDREEKKKESIDDILSDLNGLLNKMPSILDGIKMPEAKPVDFQPRSAPSSNPPSPTPPPQELDKTIVINSLSSLPEGAELPAEAPAQESPVTAPEAGLASTPGQDSSGDLAIPDIDALLQFTQEAQGEAAIKSEPQVDVPVEEIAAAAAPAVAEASMEPAAAPGQEPILAPEAELPSDADLAEFEKQLSGLVLPQDGDPAPEEDKTLVLEPPAAAMEPEQPFSAAEILPSGETTEEGVNSSDAPVLEPAPELSLGVSEPGAGEGLTVGGETMEILPSGDNSADGQEKQPEPEAVPQEEPALEIGGIQLEPQPSIGGVEAFPTPDPLAETAQAQAPESQPAEQQGEPQLSVGAAPALADGDATLVMPAQGGAEEEKTVVFQAGAGPGVTNRAKLEDLDTLAAMAVPQGVTPERVRSLYFLYSPAEGALCASLLAELDAVCGRSMETPMFIKRAGVAALDPDMNANFVLQTTTDSGAVGLICVGDVPQEKLYEIENVFNSSGAMFRHYDRGNFNHSAVLDLVLETILR